MTLRSKGWLLHNECFKLYTDCDNELLVMLSVECYRNHWFGDTWNPSLSLIKFVELIFAVSQMTRLSKIGKHSFFFSSRAKIAFITETHHYSLSITFAIFDVFFFSFLIKLYFSIRSKCMWTKLLTFTYFSANFHEIHDLIYALRYFYF